MGNKTEVSWYYNFLTSAEAQRKVAEEHRHVFT